MAEKYGVTDSGFVIKRMDTILDEIHAELSEGFGIDTKVTRPSLLDTMITTFAGQIAGLWEVAQESYYSKFPSTATGINLDNAVQFSGIRRRQNKATVYPIHVTGEDGSFVDKDTEIASNTKPEIILKASVGYEISRSNCNSLKIVPATTEDGIYTIQINGVSYTYNAVSADTETIINGLAAAIDASKFKASVVEEQLFIEAIDKATNCVVNLTDNLTTTEVTTIANYETENFGKISIPNGVITKVITYVSGLESVKNMLQPTYGQLMETDTELRHSYIAKIAARSSGMIESVVSELLNNVEGVTSAIGYENDTNSVNSNGLPPHSIEIIVQGGNEVDIASAILAKKAGGIQTFGNIQIDVPGKYGDVIPIRFNRPVYLYTWLKVFIHAKASELPINYKTLVVDAIYEDTKDINAGEMLYIQTLTERIYSSVSGVTFINIYAAKSVDQASEPTEDSFVETNLVPSKREMLITSKDRIEVVLIEE